MQPVEETEDLQGEEQQAIDEDYHHGIIEKDLKAHCMYGWREIICGIPRYKQLQYIRLNQCYKGHGAGCYSWRIRKDIDCQTQEETPKQNGILRVVASEMKHQIDIQQRRRTMEQLYMVEHQYLSQQQKQEDQQTM